MGGKSKLMQMFGFLSGGCLNFSWLFYPFFCVLYHSFTAVGSFLIFFNGNYGGICKLKRIHHDVSAGRID